MKIVCKLAAVGLYSACLYGFYCDGMQDPLLKSRCEGGVCVCSGEFVQKHTCLPNVTDCAIKESSTSDSHPASVCTRISSTDICSKDFTTYHCYANTNPYYEVHVLGSYQATPSDSPEISTVRVVRQGGVRRKVVLVLTSTRPVVWYLDLESGIVIDQVILVCKTASLATVASSKLGLVREVIKLTNTTQGQNELYGKGKESVELLQYLSTKYGTVTSFTGRYQVNQWRLRIGWPSATGASEVPTSSLTSVSRETTTPLRPSITNSDIHKLPPSSRNVHSYPPMSKVTTTDSHKQERTTTKMYRNVLRSTPVSSVSTESSQSDAKRTTRTKSPSSNPPVTPSSLVIQHHSSVSHIVPDQPQIIPSVSFFQAFGTMELRHVSGMDYYVNGTLRLLYPPPVETENATSRTSMETSTAPMVTSTLVIVATSTVYITSNTIGLRRAFSSTSSSSFYTTVVACVLQVTASSSRSYKALSSTPGLNTPPSSIDERSTSVFPSSIASSTQVHAKSSSVHLLPTCAVTNPCHMYAVCTDTLYGTVCSCKGGFTGTGLFCRDIDECGSNPCDKNAQCNNTFGSFTCDCKKGFAADGNTSCADIDECSGSNSCDTNATCNNTFGSYTCECKKGFAGNGTFCTAKNCKELKQTGITQSGVYLIDPDGLGSFNVSCDMTIDGGGWTVFQRRMDGSVDFFFKWKEYKNGFGNMSGEFWLGLDKIHRLTKNKDKELRVDLEDFEGNKTFANYKVFKVDAENQNYKLTVGNFTGDARDSLAYHSGMKFSTNDKDNDVYPGSCAVHFKGAWWYKVCYRSNLNGEYHHGKHNARADGVIWRTWKGYYYSLKKTEMKIRPQKP